MTTAISALILGGLVVAIYQFNELTRLNQNSLMQSEQLQQAATVLNHDIVSAQSGQVSGQTLSLQIPTVSFGVEDSVVTKTVIYALDGGGLLTRNEGGGEVVVARYIDSVSFTPTGPITSSGTVSVTIVTGIQEQADSTTFVLHRRPSN